MMADMVTVEPIRFATPCEVRECGEYADFTVDEVTFDGEDVGVNGHDTGYYCEGHTPAQVALRLR